MARYSITVHSPIGKFEGGAEELNDKQLDTLKGVLKQLSGVEYFVLESGSSTIYFQREIIQNSAVILRLLA